jgi:apolipoprotein N-acyltransferase
MPTQTLKATKLEPEPDQQASRPASQPQILALTSALLLWFSFPPTGWGWLAWVALTPLFLLVPSNRSPISVYLAAWLGGLLFWLMSIQWVRLTDPTAWLAWLVMAAALSLWWPAFLFLARLAVRRLKVPLMLGVPVVWVALEFLRAFVLTGFPWYYLAHSQYLYIPLIQIADVAGALGLSFLVAMANACWVDLLTLPLFQRIQNRPRLARPQLVRLSILAIGLAGTLGYGAFRISTARFRPGPTLALVQSNIKQVYKNSLSPEKIVAIYENLIARVYSSADRPDLIVWPETSYPYNYVKIDPTLDAASLEREIQEIHPTGTINFWLTKQQSVVEHLHGWTDSLNVPMLVGTIFYDFERGGVSRFNSAILFEPGTRSIQLYNKLHLVPFGEYVPLVKTFPWLINLTPYRGADHIPGLTFGTEPRWFDLKGFRLATAICFEDTLPDVVRRFFHETADGRQPDLLLNLSNDGWFQWSEELDMHLAVSVFRAVENRVPLARAVNTGISALVDGNGQIVASLPKNTQGLLTGIAQLDDRESLYSAWGDWLGQACLAVSIGLLPMAVGHSVHGRWRSIAKSNTSTSLPNSV